MMNKNNEISNNIINISKEQLLYLEGRVKKLIDNGNYELASIMAKNILNYIDKDNKDSIKKLKLKYKI